MTHQIGIPHGDRFTVIARSAYVAVPYRVIASYGRTGPPWILWLRFYDVFRSLLICLPAAWRRSLRTYVKSITSKEQPSVTKATKPVTSTLLSLEKSKYWSIAVVTNGKWWRSMAHPSGLGSERFFPIVHVLRPSLLGLT